MSIVNHKRLRSRQESYRSRAARLRDLWEHKDRIDWAVTQLENTFTVGQIARLKRGFAA